jgi:hypothetical protein
VRPFDFSDRTFDNHMIDLSIVVPLLPLIVKVGIEASVDGEDCAMGRKVVGLLRRITNL